MELVADTAATGGGKFRYDAAAGLTGEVLRLRGPVVARALAHEQVVAPGKEQPGSEVLVPLYHAAQLVGVWSVRHSDPAMYRDSDGDMLALLAPQLALMLAIEGSVQPVVGASDRTSAYMQTLTATTQQIHASSEEVAASARRASQGAAQAAGLVSALAREATELAQHAGEVAAAGDETRASGAQMEQTTQKIRLATQAAVRRLSDLGVTTEESAREVLRLRDVAEQAHGSRERAGTIGRSLEQAKGGAHSSTEEAEAVAAAAAEQLQAIEGLARGASELAALADHLAKAVRFVRGENGR